MHVAVYLSTYTEKGGGGGIVCTSKWISKSSLFYAFLEQHLPDLKIINRITGSIYSCTFIKLFSKKHFVNKLKRTTHENCFMAWTGMFEPW